MSAGHPRRPARGLDPSARRLYPEWDALAQEVADVLRFNAARFPDDAELAALVWRSYDCFNRRDPDAVKPLYTPDCRWSFRHFAGWPEDQEYRGHDGLVRLFDDFLSAWGEFDIVPLALWHLGDDRWFIHCQMTATGVSSGVPLQLEFWQIGTVVGGRIDAVEQYTDRVGALRDAGLEPSDL